MASWDAVVVGAGPAGSAFAREAAAGGARVLLLDRARFPRDKTCGDALGLDALRELAEAGLEDRVRRAAEVSFDGVRLVAPSGAAVELTTRDRRIAGFATSTACVPRRVLDALLVEAAVEAGAELREGAEVVEPVVEAGGRAAGVRLRGGEVVRAPLVVGCGGERDPVRRLAGPRRGPRAFGIRLYHEGLREPVDLPTISFARYVLPGYGWVFPVAPDRANVGVGLRAGDLRGRNLRRLLERFVASDPWARRWLAGARPAGPVRGWPLSMGAADPRAAGPGWMLCGDAAGLVHPVTGEGIGAALASGRMAARALLERGEDAPTVYQEAVRGRFSANFRAAALAAALVRRPAVVERLVRQAGRRFELGTALAAMVSGAWPTTRAFRPANLLRVLW